MMPVTFLSAVRPRATAWDEPNLLKAATRLLMEEALAMANDDLEAAARILGCHVSTLYRHVKNWGATVRRGKVKMP